MPAEGLRGDTVTTSDIWTSMELQTKMGGKLAIPDVISSPPGFICPP